MDKKYFIDNSHIEHGCCWDAAICCKVAPGEGMYGSGIALVCECDMKDAQMIVDALNNFTNGYVPDQSNRIKHFH